MTEGLIKSHLNPSDHQEIQALQGPILVIGAGGFVGSHVFHQIRSVRPDVYACGSKLGDNWRLNWISASQQKENFLELDISHRDTVEQLFFKIRPMTVFNFAAYGAYEAQKDSDLIFNINLYGVKYLLETMEKYPVRAFVNAGSSSEYGLNCQGPAESDDLIPNSEYAVSKASAGHLIKYFGKIKNQPVVHLRLYSIYGPWEDPTRLIPKVVEHGLKSQYPNLVNPKISRDFVFVDDCLRAFVKTALTVCPNRPGAILNVGTGTQTTIEEIARTAQSLFSIASEPTFGSMAPRKWDLENWFANPKSLQEALSWKPMTSLRQGLEWTRDWELVIRNTTIKKGKAPVLHRKKISAVIACYKDDQAIPIMYDRLVQSFHKSQVDYEIIFVNDCSPTDDLRVIKDIVDKDSRVIGISHSRNFGSQAAFLSGMEISTGDAVVLLDGDLQDPPELILDFVEKWLQGFEVVYGIRVRREAPILMQWAYRLFYRIFRALADVQIPLDAGDFSLIDRKVVKKLLTFRERDFFLRGLRAWVGFKQIGVPYIRPERMFGTTTNNFQKNIWWAKKGIFSFSVKPLDYVQRLGLWTIVISFLLSCFYIGSYFLGGNEIPRGITTIFILTLGMGGLQIFSISILGEYLKKIVEEVKGRPRYIRSEVYRRDQDL